MTTALPHPVPLPGGHSHGPYSHGTDEGPLRRERKRLGLTYVRVFQIFHPIQTTNSDPVSFSHFLKRASRHPIPNRKTVSRPHSESPMEPRRQRTLHNGRPVCLRSVSTLPARNPRPHTQHDGLERQRCCPPFHR